MKVSIIIPVVREDKVKDCLKAIRKNAGPVENYEVVWKVDRERIGCPAMVGLLTKKATFDVVMFLGDDTLPEPGFLDAAVKAMETLPDGWGVVGLNTQDPGGSNNRAHWMAHKKMLSYMGGAFFPLCYQHCYCDEELKDIAQELDRWVFAEDSKIIHDHPVNDTAEYDEYYEKAYTDKNLKNDFTTYHRRRIARTKKRMGMRLGIAWPHTDQLMQTQFVTAFLALKKPDYEFFYPLSRGPLDTVRNDLVMQALRAGVTHLWMTDTDQVYYDADTLTKMIAHNRPLVSLPVQRRYPPFDPILMRHVGNEVEHIPFEEVDEAMRNGGTVEADITGMGSVLFDMNVFLDIERPWFKSPEPGKPDLGEDIYFWHKANKSGYGTLVDCSIKIEHLTTMGVEWGTHIIFRKLQEAKENGERK